MSLNKITLIGNVGKDAEMSYTLSGQALTKFSLAVSSHHKNAAGAAQEETIWFRIVAFGKQAEYCNNYVKKGSKVYVEGRLEAPHVYTDKAGNPAVSLEVRLQAIELCSAHEAQPDELIA